MAESYRLIFEVKEGSIDLIDVKRVAARAPASDAGMDAERDEATVGKWIELRDQKRIAYRRSVGPMFETSWEIQTGDKQQPFKRVAATRARTVEIMVPVLDKAQRLVLVERGARRRKRGEKVDFRETEHIDVDLAGYGHGERRG